MKHMLHKLNGFLRLHKMALWTLLGQLAQTSLVLQEDLTTSEARARQREVEASFKVARIFMRTSGRVQRQIARREAELLAPCARLTS